VIRPACHDDAKGIAYVQVETWRAAYAHAIPGETLAAADVRERAELWERWLAGSSATFVGEIDGEIRGFVNVGESRDEPGVGELFSIYVLPDDWGTGLGTQLIDRGEEELRERGYAEAVLNELADNPRAQRFYERQWWVRGDTFRSTVFGHEVELARHRKTLARRAEPDMPITTGV
jgi:ribosomal protein S18 acetylase RimI-like enzyme